MPSMQALNAHFLCQVPDRLALLADSSFAILLINFGPAATRESLATSYRRFNTS